MHNLQLPHDSLPHFFLRLDMYDLTVTSQYSSPHIPYENSCLPFSP
jgi:hypothetical protein